MNLISAHTSITGSVYLIELSMACEWSFKKRQKGKNLKNKNLVFLTDAAKFLFQDFYSLLYIFHDLPTGEDNLS